MPIYLYEPTLWTENEPVKECCFFEKIQSFKEEPLIHCPTCGHEVHRAVTSFSISTKENPPTGEDDFYKTFNKNKDSPSAKAAQLAMRHICSSGCQH